MGPGNGIFKHKPMNCTVKHSHGYRGLKTKPNYVCSCEREREREGGRGGGVGGGRRRRKEEMYFLYSNIISCLTRQKIPLFRKFQQELEGLHRPGHAYIFKGFV